MADTTMEELKQMGSMGGTGDMESFTKKFPKWKDLLEIEYSAMEVDDSGRCSFKPAKGRFFYTTSDGNSAVIINANGTIDFACSSSIKFPSPDLAISCQLTTWLDRLRESMGK